MIDPLERPVVGAMVTAEIAGEVIARTPCDAEGRFVFGKLPADTVVVRALATGAIGGAWLDLLGLERQYAILRTMPARAVSGVVVDDAGARVGGAWVMAAPDAADPIAVASCVAQADDQGRFVLQHVPFGRDLVRAWAPGYDAFAGELDGCDAAPITCVVLREAVIERTFDLVGEGAAERTEARLLVRAWHNGMPLPLPPALRAPRRVDDRWTCAGWCAADAMSCRLDGVAVAPRGYLIPEQTGSRQRDFRIVDAGEAQLTGYLAGPGAANAWLAVKPLGDARGDYRVVVQADGTGHFSLPAPVAAGEDYVLRIVHGECAVATEQAGDAAAKPATNGWLVARFEPGRTERVAVASQQVLALQVVDADNRPVTGAEILVSQPTADPRKFLDTSGRTDEAGCLRLECPSASGKRAYVSIRSLHGNLQCEIDPGTRTHTFQLEQVATLRIHCRDQRGAPLPGARITFPYGDSTTIVADGSGDALIGSLWPNSMVALQIAASRAQVVTSPRADTAMQVTLGFEPVDAPK